MSIPPAARRPAGVEPLFIDTASGRLAALRGGPLDGTALLLVPGFTGSKEDFLPVFPDLAAAGFCVTAIDQRGQFESGWNADYSLDAFAADVAEVGAQLAGGGPLHVVGHSFGGLVCRQAVLSGAAPIVSLTLLNSGPGPLPQEHQVLLHAMREMIPVADLEQIWRAKKLLDQANNVPEPDPGTEAFLHRRWVANDPANLFAVAGHLMTAPDRTDELAQSGVRLRVMAGANDETAWPVPELLAMARRLGGEAVVIPDAAHSPAVENPAATVAELVAFVSDV